MIFNNVAKTAGASIAFGGRHKELSSIRYQPNRTLEMYMVHIVLYFLYSILASFVDNIVFHREEYDYCNLKSYETVKSNS